MPESTPKADVLDWLAEWYATQCDGDWEHRRGPVISTVSNPGWCIEFDLAGTDCDGRGLDKTTERLSHPSEWWTCWTENNSFHGVGGPSQLRTLLEEFRRWATMKG